MELKKGERKGKNRKARRDKKNASQESEKQQLTVFL